MALSGDFSSDNIRTPYGIIEIEWFGMPLSKIIPRNTGALSISNTIYLDDGSSQSAFSGAFVAVLDAASGEMIATTTSGVDGAYSFSGLSADACIVVAVDASGGRVAAHESLVIPVSG